MLQAEEKSAEELRKKQSDEEQEMAILYFIKKMKLFWFLLLVMFLMAVSSCTGACLGYSYWFDKYYCYDDFTEDECTQYDYEEINIANWTFHKNQTCDEL